MKGRGAMNRILGMASLALLAACSDAPDLSLPPIAVGGGGARLMSGRGSYDDCYSMMTKLHLQLREGLRPPANHLAVGGSLDEIIANLEAMQAAVIPEQRPKFDPFLKEYGEWRDAFRRGTTAGLEPAVTELERRIRISLGPSKVTLADKAEAAAPKEVVKKPEDPLLPKRDPPDKPVDEPKKPDPEVKPAKDTAYWMVYAAWKQSHADLVDAYTKKGDWKKPFDRTLESLAALKERVAIENDRASLEVYIKHYKATRDKIEKGGSEAKDDYILGDLRVVSNLIEGTFNPDKK